MASKMKKTKKQRTHKTSPNTAGTKRRNEQELRAEFNATLHRTPWEKAKDERFHSADRVAKRAAYYKRAVKSENKDRGGRYKVKESVSAG